MAGTVAITKKGIEKLVNVFKSGDKITISKYKVSAEDVQINDTVVDMTDIPKAWKEGDIAGVLPLDENSVEFVIHIPMDQMTDYGRTFGLYDQDGDLIFVAKPDHPFYPLTEVTYRIQYKAGKLQEIVNYNYIASDWLETQQLILDTIANNQELFIELFTKVQKLESAIKFDLLKRIDDFTKSSTDKISKLQDFYKQELEKTTKEIQGEILQAEVSFAELISDKLIDYEQFKFSTLHNLQLLEQITNTRWTEANEIFEKAESAALKYADLTLGIQSTALTTALNPFRHLLATGLLATPYISRNLTKIPPDLNTSVYSWSVMGIHNHPNYRCMPGMGMLTVNVNGAILETRHNDYRLMKKGNGPNDIIPAMPPEPPENASIDDMKQLFAKYLDGQLSSDEKRYFRWDLAYLEAYWVIVDRDGNIQDQFSSFRHGFGSPSLRSLIKKSIDYYLHGIKPRNENIPIFPVVKIDGDRFAVMLYRILVQPIEELNGMLWNEFLMEYDLFLPDYYDARNFYAPYKRFRLKKEIQDILQKIPGLDGAAAEIRQGVTPDGQKLAADLNYAYYFRYPKYLAKDAVNSITGVVGYNDPTLFIALTRDPNIWGQVSYLIPLEFILRTPLELWNPLNLQHKDYDELTKHKGSADDPLPGYNERAYYYLTPAEFYQGQIEGTPADTAYAKYVKDSSGNIHYCYGAGIYVTLPEIKDVGKVRIRYPVFYHAVEEGIIGSTLATIDRKLMLTILDQNMTLQKYTDSKIDLVQQRIDKIANTLKAVTSGDKVVVESSSDSTTKTATVKMCLYAKVTVDADKPAGTVITLPDGKKYHNGQQTLQVYLNRVKLLPQVDYQEVDDTRVKFLLPLKKDDVIEFIEFCVSS